MARAAQAETHRMNGLLGKITDDAVSATSQVERLKLWLVQNGVVLPSTTEPTEDGDEEDEDDEASTSNSKKSPWKLRKSDIADILARNDVPEKCREALALRAEAGKASVRKLHRMLGFATSDSRLHGIIKLGGAQQTMRWSSGGPQLHNMVRDSFGNIDEIAEVNSLDLKKADHKKFAQYLQQVSLTTAIQVGRTGDAELIRMLYERRVKDAQGRSSMAGVLTWISRMSRRTIAAERGKVFLNGDFSSAQARITVWLAQQLNMIQAYYNNEDTYKVAAAGIYHTTIELITKMQRQAGKVSILAGGFGGGPKALMAMAYNYGMLLTLQEATEIIKLWRAANQQTEEMWYATDDAAANAVLNPGREYHVPPCGLVSYFMLDNALCCRLPSGRLLRYWAPRLTQEYWPGGKPKDRLSLSALVVKGGYVFRNSIYHTILCNNYVQAIEADMLAVTLDNLEQAGLPASLHVHDNAASEVLEDHASDFLPTFKQCMLAQPGWTYGLPIGCDIEISARFG
jgi:DNA polymerase